MSHEFETGFFVGQPAWHGLGILLQEPPTIADAITASGLDWAVSLRPALFVDPMLGCLLQSGHQVVVRETDQAPLGVVGPAYTPIQNHEAFRCFEPLVASGQVTLEAAGSLRGGKRIWVLGKLRGVGADILPGDEVNQYVLMANAHDGSLCAHFGLTGVRVVCQNTYSMALGDSRSKLLRIKHTRNAPEAMGMASTILDAVGAEFRATAEQLRFLARTGCSEETLRKYVREVFAIKPDPVLAIEGEPEVAAEAPKLEARIIELAETGRGADIVGVRGTLWGAFNAITEYVTHERGQDRSIRLDSQWFGQGAALTKRALKVGLQLAA